MARNITITFNDGSSHRYENIPDTVTPDMIESRVNKDFPGKKIKNIDGGKKPAKTSSSAPTATPSPITKNDELDQVKKNAGMQSQQQSTSSNNQIGKTGKVFENNDWFVRVDKDQMTDKVDATVFGKGDLKFVQGSVNPDQLWIGYRGRGGLQSLKYRIDNNPPEEKYFGRSSMNAWSINFDKLQGASRLRVQAFTILDNFVNDDINLKTFTEALLEAKKYQ